MSGIAKNHGLTANNRILVVYRFLDISFGAAAPQHSFSLKSLYKNGIGGTVTRPPLPHHRRCGSAYGGSEGYASPSKQARETKRVEVSDGKRVRQGRTVRQMPRAVWAARRSCGELPTDPEMAQLRVPLLSAFPLLPDHGSQPTSYPFLQSFQQRGCLTEAEVALPAS